MLWQKELTPCLVTAVATTVVIWQMMWKRTKCYCEFTPSFYTLCLQFIKRKEKEKCCLFSERPHCDSKWICLSKDVKTISKWQAMKATEGDGEGAQEMQLKLWVNKIGKARKKEGQRDLGKQTCSLSYQEQMSAAALWKAPWTGHTLKKATCAPKGVSVMGCLLLKFRWNLWAGWGHASISTVFVSPPTLERKEMYSWLKQLHLMVFFLHEGGGEPALPQKWFPNKIINNSVGTLFLERRFVSVPQWGSRENQLLHIKEKVIHLKQNKKQKERKNNFHPVFNCKNMVEEKEDSRETPGPFAFKSAILHWTQKCFSPGWCRDVSAIF